MTIEGPADDAAHSRAQYATYYQQLLFMTTEGGVLVRTKNLMAVTSMAFALACGSADTTPEEHAEMFCEFAISCNAGDFDSVAECVRDELTILSDAASVSDECHAAEVRLLQCLNSLSCDMLSAYFDESPGFPCSAEEQSADRICDPF